MLHELLSLLALTSTATSLTIRQTTGPSGGSSPYATSTNITYYQGVTASTGSIHQSSYTADANDCGQYVFAGTIQAGVCTKFTTQGVGIWGSENGSCSLTLYRGSDSCGEDAEKEVVAVGNGDDEVTCVATGVMDGGLHYHGSGVWVCG
ncbi:hypothetical protein M409DRAFT_18943 [Zasmidium cellare ATCC 36951]|uniref:Ecp2 effector protein domain-containing protein n=1 Tax=Zasmidium cellare ATCC 36951 TaxID=1080233 RepID=A0A6A6CW87_ZASCE|nr:uncharacterized protein M409DRAFT_18943 [Zasmidium cellare ATCC 36951]KAF2170973.1 hypothetical protein M409DRAFT_18943 [Zasmidium cellare ATCC 36951]